MGGVEVTTLFIPGVLKVNENELPSWRGQIRHMERLVKGGVAVSVIVFDLVHWEVAYASHIQFLSEVTEFAEALLTFSLTHVAGVGNDTDSAFLMIYRRPNYYLGPPGVAFPSGRFDTHGRHQLFARIAEDTLKDVLGERLVIWDAFNVQQSKTWENTLAHMQQCTDLGRACFLMNYPPSEEHEVLLRLLFNELCY